ncbi:Dabb family protein [Lampropedia aestuarii]|nr:Dabb family protein [Lampropedia aestuarii]MDH5857926.1 Dabb family protein [Lampropedia aestuarii]
MMEFTAAAGPEFFAQVQAFAKRILQECTGVQLYHFGANEADRSSGYSHAVVSVFESSAEHDRYQISPAHVEMKAYMGPFIQRIAVYDGGAL